MPIASDNSPMTSISPSPLDSYESSDLPLELKIPLPSSPVDSDNIPQQNARERQDAPGVQNMEVEMPEEKVSIPATEKKDSSKTEDVSKESPVEHHIAAHISLADLATLVQEEEYSRSLTSSMKKDAEKLALANGLNRRLRDTLSIAYGNMIDQYKGDDQAGFTGLFEASERLVSHCSAQASKVPSKDPSEIAAESPEASSSQAERSPMYRLRQEDQDAISSFLNRLRTDLDYLAELVSHLPSDGLTALTSSYHPAGVDLSVLPNHSHGRTQAFSRDSQMMKLSRRMDAIDRFHTQDPYFTMLYGLFDSSSPPASLEHRRKTEIWARTCAKIMSEGKPGNDEFAIATIDSFVDTTRWTLKPDMELYILQVLAEGSFLLDPPPEHVPERPMLEEPDRASHAIAKAEYFDKHTRRLFSMFTGGSPFDVVPEGVLRFIHATLRHIRDPESRERAKRFSVGTWFFGCFLSSVLVYPEVHGMLMNHHVGQSARKDILHELVVRLQEQMFAILVPSGRTIFVLPEVHDHIHQIVGFFDPPPSGVSETHEGETLANRNFQQLMMSHWDIIGLIEALHPFEMAASAGSSMQPFEQPSSCASSATLHPGQGDNNAHEASATIQGYAASSSTDGTFIGERSAEEQTFPNYPKDNNSRAQVLHGNEYAGLDPSQRLRNVCSKLRELSKRHMGSYVDSTPGEWAFFDVSSEHTTISLSPQFSADPTVVSQELLSTPSSKLYSILDKEYTIVSQVLPTLLPFPKDLPTVTQPASAEPSSSLEGIKNLIEGRLTEARWKHDFIASHRLWRILEAYNKLQKSERGVSLYHDLTAELAQRLRTSIHHLALQRERIEGTMRVISYQSTLDVPLKALALRRKALRVKVWYVSDVKNSSLYEDALRVTKTLRTMASSKKEKQTGGLSTWARQRLRGMNPYDRADRQALESMCAPKNHGGLTKLADEQVEMTARWLTKNSIENLCKGEERINRFCCEVQRSVGKLAGTSSLDNPVLWSSHLFRKEKATFDGVTRQTMSPTSFPSPGISTIRPQGSNSLRSPIRAFGPPYSPSMADPRSNMPMDLSGGLQINSLPYAGRSPVRGNFGFSNPSLHPAQAFGYLSPPMTPRSPQISQFYNANLPPRTEAVSKPKNDFVEELRKILLGLMLSDLGYLIWVNGSETDVWINRAASQTMDAMSKERPYIDADVPTIIASSNADSPPSDQDVTTVKSANNASADLEGRDTKGGPDDSTSDAFPYTESYSKILQRMSLSQDPYEKLRMLSQLEELVVLSLHEDGCQPRSSPEPPEREHHAEKPTFLPSRTVPRTKATSLEEAKANCTERRANTIKRTQPRSPIPSSFLNSQDTSNPTIGADQIVSTLLNILRSDILRPHTLYRDLQYIASFIPPATLDQTPQGKAFWDVSLAALALKEELMNANIARATEITTYHLTVNKPPQVPDTKIQTPLWLTRTTLRDAAHLWVTSAKEGSPVAARELALFYLTHPEMLRRVTMPLSEAKDVFGVISPLGQTSGGVLDPLTFAVVLHWMNVAANGGDGEARDFLRDNGALGRL